MNLKKKTNTDRIRYASCFMNTFTDWMTMTGWILCSQTVHPISASLYKTTSAALSMTSQTGNYNEVFQKPHKKEKKKTQRLQHGSTLGHDTNKPTKLYLKIQITLLVPSVGNEAICYLVPRVLLLLCYYITAGQRWNINTADFFRTI